MDTRYTESTHFPFEERDGNRCGSKAVYQEEIEVVAGGTVEVDAVGSRIIISSADISGRRRPVAPPLFRPRTTNRAFLKEVRVPARPPSPPISPIKPVNRSPPSILPNKPLNRWPPSIFPSTPPTPTHKTEISNEPVPPTTLPPKRRNHIPRPPSAVPPNFGPPGMTPFLFNRAIHIERKGNVSPSWEDSVVGKHRRGIYRLDKHCHDNGRKAEIVQVTNGRFSSGTLELIRQRGAPLAAGNHQLMFMLAKLCREAIREGLKELRAAVLAEAAGVGRSIRYAPCSPATRP
ncbi:hypothetical protein TELCIR_11188 [Teladorsagia circumcincta]|uniref:Uncharacterized protein n=1 Tax=Teladorsagia circumcincta TaxID=45464 RepID=A0A2G9U9Z5_TELCI|nr:hypothetical protein TELCIR_11188 [Teladorsagia circumcincta]